MKLRNCLLLTFVLSLSWPLMIQAQEKRRFEINVGVSTPGLFEMRDTRWYDIGYETFDYYYYDKSLSDLEKSCFRTTIYPCLSVELAYDLAESGFFKRLDLLGFLNYHYADYDEVDIVSKTSTGGTARKLSLLFGVRYDIIKHDSFNMYTQMLMGGCFSDGSPYWDHVYSDVEGERIASLQITFLGFNWRVGGEKSRWGIMFEFGYGHEYGLSELPVFPGIRGGLSYKF